MTQEVFCVQMYMFYNLEMSMTKKGKMKKEEEKKSLWEIKPLFYCVYFYYKKIRSAQKETAYFFFLCVFLHHLCVCVCILFVFFFFLVSSQRKKCLGRAEKRKNKIWTRERESFKQRNATLHVLCVWRTGIWERKQWPQIPQHSIATAEDLIFISI